MNVLGEAALPQPLCPGLVGEEALTKEQPVKKFVVGPLNVLNNVPGSGEVTFVPLRHGLVGSIHPHQSGLSAVKLLKSLIMSLSMKCLCIYIYTYTYTYTHISTV